MLKILITAGARPNFIKIAPLMTALADVRACNPVLVHTGQHYDAVMSDVFFQELQIPHPMYSLGVGSGSHGSKRSQGLNLSMAQSATSMQRLYERAG